MVRYGTTPEGRCEGRMTELAKLFSGCIFNELIPENSLGKMFIEKLIEKYSWTCNQFGINQDLEVKNYLKELKQDLINNHINLTFDYYLSRVTDDSDRGELADIFISGLNTFISIEAKYNTDYKYEKDIISNRKRIIKAMEKTNFNGIQALLVTETKWDNSVIVNRKDTDTIQYQLLKKDISSCKSSVPFIVLFWEDVLDVISRDKRMNKVCDYLSEMIGLRTNWDEFSMCELSEKRWDLFSYGYDKDVETYNITWCNGVGIECDAVDTDYCGMRNKKIDC